MSETLLYYAGQGLLTVGDYYGHPGVFVLIGPLLLQAESKVCEFLYLMFALELACNSMVSLMFNRHQTACHLS